jgi:heptosyltransferase-1
MTSMGDLIHTFPAVHDAISRFPSAQIDWVVETPFDEVVRWHPAIRNIIVSNRPQWRKNRFALHTLRDVKRFYSQVRNEHYDAVIDAQGRVKSAKAVFWARGRKFGLHSNIATDTSATLAYDETIRVEMYPHVINRIRQLFAKSLGYEFDPTVIDYGLSGATWPDPGTSKPYLMFLHGTTWETKHWLDTYWVELARIAADNGYRILLPWATKAEHDRARHIAGNIPQAQVLERMNLTQLSAYLAHAAGVVGVDTGLAHIAAALGRPTLALYGGSISTYTGVLGHCAASLQAQFECSPCGLRYCNKAKPSAENFPPCFATLTPQQVWQELTSLMQKDSADHATG